MIYFLSIPSWNCFSFFFVTLLMLLWRTWMSELFPFIFFFLFLFQVIWAEYPLKDIYGHEKSSNLAWFLALMHKILFQCLFHLRNCDNIVDIVFSFYLHLFMKNIFNKYFVLLLWCWEMNQSFFFLNISSMY